LKWKDAEEKERFLISVYIDYLGDGVINQEQFNFKCQKSVEQLGKSVDDYINLFKDTETLEKPTNDIWKSEFEKINKKLAELEKREPEVKEVIKEVPVEKIKEVIKEVPVVKEVPKVERKIIEKGLSEKVDQKAAELDELIKDI
jgi:geranylgeranyl pyrophosphate synthase